MESFGAIAGLSLFPPSQTSIINSPSLNFVLHENWISSEREPGVTCMYALHNIQKLLSLSYARAFKKHSGNAKVRCMFKFKCRPGYQILTYCNNNFLRVY